MDEKRDEFQERQKEEIRLGGASGVDVTVYAKPEYNWLQMEQLRLGLEENVDVSIFACQEYSHETMKQLRKAIHAKVDLMPYVKAEYADTALAEIRVALEEDLDIKKWIEPDMLGQQIREIRLGLEEGLDVQIYANIAYNWLQMQEIRKGLEERLDVTIYARPLMEHKQMQEVRYGLEAGLDVSSYCDLTYTVKDMRNKRIALVDKLKEQHNLINVIPEDEQLNKSDISVMVEENGTKAYIYIERVKGVHIREKDIIDGLRKYGVKHGLLNEQIELVAKKQMYDRNILVAEGTEPIQGEDGWYEYFVRKESKSPPVILSDGSVDYTAVEAMESVDAGQILAVYHPATEGTPGIDVFGKSISSHKGSEKPTMKGSGFSLAPDRVTYIAKKSGKVDISEDRIEVTDVIIIPGDVTSVSGKIDVNGSVYVMGSVCAGASIKATKDIVIENNVEGGTICAGRDIIVKRGCCSMTDCMIEADGEVSGKFFEAVNIKCKGNICANYIMNSQISTMGKVIISGFRGVLFGGKTFAMRGVDAYNIGNNSNLLTVLDVGKNETYHEKLAVLKKQKEKCAEEIHVYEEGRSKLIANLSEEDEKSTRMLSKIETAIKMKRDELPKIEEKIKRLADIVEKGNSTPIVAKGTVYGGTLIMIDGSKYLLYQDVKNVSFKRREKKIVMSEF